MIFSASICKNNEIILFLDQIFIVGNTCPWSKQYLCIVKQNYVYVITRSDGKKMLIFIFKSNHRGVCVCVGGGLVLVSSMQGKLLNFSNIIVIFVQRIVFL